MRKGIDIKTIRNKKTYQAPVLEEVTLDRDIILMQTSKPFEPPFGSSSLYSTSGSETVQSNKETNSIFPESENPFGGGTPEYE